MQRRDSASKAQFIMALQIMEMPIPDVTLYDAQKRADQEIVKLRERWAAKRIRNVDCTTFREQLIDVFLKGYTFDANEQSL
jgi:hypothetical protein